MEQSKKIIGINLAILLGYTIIIQLIAQINGNNQYQSLFVLIVTMYAMIAHIGIHFLIAIFYFFKDDGDTGKVFLLSSLIVLLVGFSTCWGSSFLSGFR